MNTYLPHSLVSDHIRESRQQAAAARKASAVRGDRRRTGSHARRFSHLLVRGA